MKEGAERDPEVCPPGLGLNQVSLFSHILIFSLLRGVKDSTYWLSQGQAMGVIDKGKSHTQKALAKVRPWCG